MAASTDVRAVLRRVALLDGLAEADLGRVVEAGFQRRLEEGGFLFFQGTPARHAYVVLDGRLRLVQTTSDGERVVVRYVRAGDVLGLVAVLGGMDYPVTAEVVEATVVLGWSGEALRDLMLEHPRLALNAMTHMADMVRDLLRRLRDLSTERVERRIARALLRLVGQAGRPVEAGVEVAFPVTRQEIAEMTGTTLYTVSRVLRQWERAGILQTRRGRIVVRDVSALVGLGGGRPAADLL